MATDDHYATLRVPPDADGGAIRSAYRALMRRYHPDVNGSRGAGARAKAINEAYACLRDPERRADYDRARGARKASSPPPPPRPSSTAAEPVNMEWVIADVGGWRRPRLGRPSWWQMLGMGGATVATAITFTATSATPEPVAVGPTYVQTLTTVAPDPREPDKKRAADEPLPSTNRGF